MHIFQHSAWCLRVLRWEGVWSVQTILVQTIVFLQSYGQNVIWMEHAVQRPSSVPTYLQRTGLAQEVGRAAHNWDSSGRNALVCQTRIFIFYLWQIGSFDLQMIKDARKECRVFAFRQKNVYFLVQKIIWTVRLGISNISYIV